MTELGKSARDIRNDDRIAEIRLDTMREGSLVRERFSRVKPGMTVAEAMDVGVSKFDIACAVARERVVLEVMKRTDLDLSRYDPRLIAARAGGGAPPAAAPEADNDANEIDQTGSITWAHLENPAVARALGEPGRGGGSFPSSAQAAEEAAHFRLEHQLRDFLADHLHLVEIDGKRPRLYQDASGRRGVEYPTAVGPIDILGIDDQGAFFVFELKRAESFDRAMGQVLRYMGYIQQTIASGRDVYGVIVARSISDKLKYARTVVPNVYLFEYGLSLSLRQAH